MNLDVNNAYILMKLYLISDMSYEKSQKLARDLALVCQIILTFLICQSALRISGEKYLESEFCLKYANI